MLLRRELEALGNEVWIVSPSAGADHSDQQRIIRVPSVPYPLYKDLRIALPLSRNFPSKVDIVHCHTPFSVGILGTRMARKQGVPVVATVHVDFHSYTHYVPLLKHAQRRLDLVSPVMARFYRQFRLLYTPSQYGKNLLRRSNLKSRIMVLPNGVNMRSLEGSPVLTSPWPPESARVLFVGRLAAEKKLRIVLRALQLVPDAHLVVIGDGPARRQTVEQISALGLTSRVAIVPSVDFVDMGSFYRSADILVSASTNETQGMAVWEAQAMGVPVVAAGAGGTAEAIIDGVTGYLAAPDDPTSFAERMRVLLQNKELHAEFSERARVWASSNSLQSSAARLLESYYRVIHESQNETSPFV
jgi:1,2-diacylglycerol 3-alpha-glucosyltransferase